MSETQEKLTKIKEEALKIEARIKDEGLKIEERAEMAIGILKKIVYKQKPNHDDIIEINKVIKILEDK